MDLGRVLVLEDEPFIALVLEGMLEEFGATSVVSSTRAEWRYTEVAKLLRNQRGAGEEGAGDAAGL